MTEVDIKQILGVQADPINNKLAKSPLLKAELDYLLLVFEIKKEEKYNLGRLPHTELVTYSEN